MFSPVSSSKSSTATETTSSVSSAVSTESFTGLERAIKSFPFATFLMVSLVIFLKNDHAVALWDMAAFNAVDLWDTAALKVLAIFDMDAYELGIGRVQLFLLISILVMIGTIFSKLLSTDIKNKKDAVRREIVGDVERLSLIRLFEATGNVRNALVSVRFFLPIYH